MEETPQIVQTIAVIILWAGGYLAAPLLFMATMGIFRNLAGMGTTPIKALSGKMRQPGREARAIGKAPKREAKQKKQESIAWGRHAALRRNMKGYKDAINPKSDGTWGDAAPDLHQWKNYKSRRRARSELSDAVYKAGAAQRDPSVQAGYLQKQASDIEAQGETFRAGKLIAETIQKYLGERDGSGNQKHSVDEARSLALNDVAGSFKKKLLQGNTTQAETTGTLTALAQQKAGNQLADIHDSIADAGRSDPGAIEATRQFSGAFGNDGAYSALTKVNPGLMKGVQAGLNKVDPNQPNAASAARGEAILGEANEKVAEATSAAWKDAYMYDAVEAGKKAAKIHSMGGEAALKLDLPKAPKAPPQQPGVDQDGKQWTQDSISKRNIELQRHNEFMKSFNGNVK